MLLLTFCSIISVLWQTSSVQGSSIPLDNNLKSHSKLNPKSKDHNNDNNKNPTFVGFSSDEELNELITRYSNTTTVLLDTRNTIAYSSIFKISSTEDHDPAYYIWDQWQVSEKGLWWDQWYPASPCVFNGLRNDINQFALHWNFNYEWNYPKESNITWSIVYSTINLNVKQRIEKIGEKSCNIPSNVVGQVWQQQHLVWADYQVQHCESKTNKQIKCGPYSPYYRVNVPIENEVEGHGYKLDCSIGWERVNC